LPVPEVQAGALSEEAQLVLDGRLNEPMWATAEVIAGLTEIEPVEGVRESHPTTVRVLASPHAIVVGITCDEPELVAYAMARDADLTEEDYVKLVFGTFRDGRTGYVFAVNHNGARYDALVAERGEDEDARWDGTWEAKTQQYAGGWSAEV